jgi:hypothetical protein
VLRRIRRAVCIRRGCTEPPQSRDLCHHHYENYRYARARRLAGVVCLIPGCGRPQTGYKLCAVHLERAERSGEFDLLPQLLASLEDA